MAEKYPGTDLLIERRYTAVWQLSQNEADEP